MPKRIVDGEALWGSSKIRRLPQEYRYHYANWVPVAEANGSFEIDLDSLLSRIYHPALDPDMDVSEVFYVLREFVIVGLIEVWKADSKVWGTFAGMDKPGRLPGHAILDRYKNLPPNKPARVPSVPAQISLLETVLSCSSHPVTPVPSAPSWVKDGEKPEKSKKLATKLVSDSQ